MTATVDHKLKRKPGYRTDIQGMRAIAVGLVLAYHARVPGFGGGYIGVDAFFVISGFLITGLMVQEVLDTGRFRLSAFYARRARRLLPATAVVLAATGLMTLVVLPATRWATIAGDTVASALYFVNWRFASQSVDYLASGDAASPVQHFWSLAVEEQFYLLWPVLLLVLLSVWKRKGWRLENTLLAGVSLVAVPSLVWSILLTQTSPGPAFFVSTTRVWEFGIGAALALSIRHIARLPEYLASIAGWLGLAALLSSALTFTEGTQFPGAAALLPTLGAVALIASGSTRSDGTLQRVLSIRPMQWTGEMSYSLYLWHWPPLVAALWVWGDTDGTLPVSIGLLVVAVSVFPAWLSYRFVEAPIHYSEFFAQIPRRALALGATCTALGLGVGWFVSVSVPNAEVLVIDGPATQQEVVAVGGSNGPTASDPVGGGEGPAEAEGVDEAGEDALSMVALGAEALGDDPAKDPAMAVVDAVPFLIPSPIAALEDKASLDGQICIDDPDEPVSCEYGAADADTVVAVVGDSKMHQWLPAIEVIADERDWRIVTYLANGCGLYRVAVHNDPATSDACIAYNTDRYATLLASDEIDYVITSQRASKAVVPDGTTEMRVEAMVEDLRATWLELEKSGIDVIVIPDNAAPPTNIPDCVEANPGTLSECAFPFEEGFAESAGPTQLEALRGLDHVRSADVQQWICAGEFCPVVIGNTLIYRKGSHLTATYVTSLVSRLDAALSSAMAAAPGP